MAERTIIYQGPLGTATGEDQTCDVMIPYFEGQGFPCEEFCNPAEYLIDIVSINKKGGFREASETQKKIEALAK